MSKVRVRVCCRSDHPARGRRGWQGGAETAVDRRAQRILVIVEDEGFFNAIAVDMIFGEELTAEGAAASVTPPPSTRHAGCGPRGLVGDTDTER